MTDTPKVEPAEPDENLAQRIRALGEGDSITTELSVDDRVIARITDGIYRQTSSALRELISNAYDADATQVIIQTDAPRFERIVIRDDGNGMSPEILSYLVHHIGGSSKRTYKGKELGTVNKKDVVASPAGRKLIGKIGIGLFAISQLTQHFQIITKRKGDDFRTSAVVVLKTHSEDNLADEDEQARFEPGTVTISKDPTVDIDAHGTDIILMNLRKSTKNGLGSVDRWQALDSDLSDEEVDDFRLGNVQRPVFHIGRVDPFNTLDFLEKPNLPWDDEDAPVVRFNKLYEALVNELGNATSNPTVATVLDSYLIMIWEISLSVPVDYLRRHPLLTGRDDGVGLYRLSNEKKGQAVELDLAQEDTISKELGMESCSSDSMGGFQVLIDEVELRHPIMIDSHIRGDHKIKIERPLMFVGKCVSQFSNVPSTLGGGPLEFEAYFYWNPIIVPKENNGILIRINGASGTLFDETFLDYRVSELTRLKQIMAEVYVVKGLDPALNIDRESFNSSHPHYQFLKDWIHRALRQTTNRLKAINKELLGVRKKELAAKQLDKLESHVDSVWEKLRGADSLVPEILVVTPGDMLANIEDGRRHGQLIIEYAQSPEESSGSSEKNGMQRNAKIKALVGILTAYGLTEGMSYDRLQALIQDITIIFTGE